MRDLTKYKDKLLFVYDNGCPQCTGATHIFHKLDWLNKISSIQLRNGTELNQLPGLDTEKAVKEMAVFYKNKWIYGFDNFILIFQKLPLLWVFVPLLYLLKWTKSGDFIYRKAALKRIIKPEFCKINK
jgi:predicted DCC family thiol-disulfide oxidoreductase YuxK